MAPNETPSQFDQLGLSAPVLKALQEIGYETPSQIQAQSIPHILEGTDLLGQAQTGTGKTAAFALPLLSKIKLDETSPQVLVLAPTRELAIQVAEAFQRYAHHMKGFHVLPIYGGQSYEIQLRHLRRGVHIVVGTPGRVMDHMRKGTLKLNNLKTLVLDEADEMLRMGFIDDVEWVLEQTPDNRQIALFSATMPREIKRVVDRHLTNQAEVTIKTKTATASTIRQRYWLVSGLQKLDALTRMLETEPFDGVIIFVRTKNSTVELAERLCARGYAAEALNGDIQQNQRERIVDRLKKGSLDILVATDVVARGLDVERISHVINYDIPHDNESYVHRIGRTGRAGREGDAILFVAPRERRMLKSIERTTRQPIEEMSLPTVDDVNKQRIERFKNRISQTLSNDNIDEYFKLVTAYQEEHDTDPINIAAALASMAQGDEPLLLPPQRETKRRDFDDRGKRQERGDRRDRSDRFGERSERREREPRENRPVDTRPRRLKDDPDIPMGRYRIEVGRNHKVNPGNIVGAIANEADIESRFIGSIEIHDDFSTVDLPSGMPNELMSVLKRARVCGQALDIKPIQSAKPSSGSRKFGGDDTSGKPKKRKFAKKEGNDSKAPPKKKQRKRDLKDKGKPKRTREGQ